MTGKLKDGLHPAIDRDHYDLIDRVNFSTLKIIDQSPAHYWHAVTSEPDDTDPMRVGRVIHIASFEPERFRSTVVEWTGKVRNGGEWNKFKAQNQGREILTSNQYAKVGLIAASVRNNKTAMEHVSRGQGEVTMLWTVTVNGLVIPCKGRIDFDGVVGTTDLKSTHDASPSVFAKHFLSMKYDVQCAWYHDARKRLTGEDKPYFIVAVETEPPFVVQTYEIGEEILERGRATYWGWLQRLAECRKSSHWPPYAETVRPLELPVWAQEDIGALDLQIGGYTHGQGLPISTDE